jgi:hypothetical protein
METKIFYRVANLDTLQGLWYDYDGNFTGLIHNKFDFCTNNKLEMPYNEEVIGWLSATDKLSDLFNWFTKDDISKLEKHGYRICIFEASEFIEYENHWLIKQDSSVVKVTISINSV